MAFALQNMIRDLHISKFQIRSPNSKKNNILYTLASFKKTENKKQKIKKVLVTSTRSKGWMK